jgi:putative ABC transport system substrate-binding protein
MLKKIFVYLLVIIIVIASSGVIWWLWSRKNTGQEKKVYHIGLLQFAPSVAENMQGFKMGMAELGFTEGVDVEYTYRDANGDLAKVEQFAKELVAAKPDLIFVNTSPATAAIKKATEGTGIPVVFSMVADPLAAGFIKSVESSGKNMTGTGCAYITIAPKRVELLKQIDPSIKKILIFYRPEDLSGGPATRSILEKAPSLGVQIVAVPIKQKEDIENYLANLKPGEVDAIMDPADSMATAGLTEWGINKARELKIPLMMMSKGECDSGALACFGVDYIDLGKQSSLIANQILRGISPTNIPTESPRKFLFVINLKTAEAIDLKIPDEVIQQAHILIPQS